MTDNPTYTIKEFCNVERISRSLLYQLWQQDRGPRYFLAETHRRITEQARQDWHRHLEAEITRDSKDGRDDDR